MPSCVKALQYRKFMLKLLHFYPWSMGKFHLANQINHAGNTLFMITTDLHEIIYPV